MNIGEICLTNDLAGTWKASADAPPLTEEEYYSVLDALERYVGEKYICGLREGYYQCEIRGDNYGDRTHYFEIIDPEIFSVELIRYLQAWLQDFPLWRIGTPCHLGQERLILIYPRRLRFIGDDRMPLEEYVSFVHEALIEREREHPMLTGIYRRP
jgi:hypothetical protein